jgi:hypothetical protein
VRQADGAPAGIEELGETRVVAGFSLQARLGHGCTCGCSTGRSVGAVFEYGIPLTALTHVANLGSLKGRLKGNIEPLGQLYQAPVQ